MCHIFCGSYILCSRARITKIPGVLGVIIAIGTIKGRDTRICKLDYLIGTTGCRVRYKICLWLFKNFYVVNVCFCNITTILRTHRNYKLPARQLAATLCKQVINRIYSQRSCPGYVRRTIAKIPGVQGSRRIVDIVFYLKPKPCTVTTLGASSRWPFNTYSWV